MSTFRVLFVCVGNICRSPFGERLLIARLPRDGFEVASAGVGAVVGAPMSPEAASELAAYGGSADRFAARQLRPDLVDVADLVLTATRDIRARVLAEAPAAFARTFTARELATLLDEVDPGTPPELVARAAEHRSAIGGVEQDVPDPYRRGPEAHRLAARTMAAAVDRIAKSLAP